jgi:broad specificity phosphatase PhoE
MIRLALLRHGHTAWNREGRIQGRTDIPLDDTARADLAQFRLPDDWQTAALWSSPLQRAMQTAELVTGRIPLTDPRLSEMNWGDWEGKHGKLLRADPDSGYRDMETWGWSFAPPSGEALSNLRARTVAWANALTSDTVAVCHIGVMRVLLAHATGYDFLGDAPFQVKRNRLFIIEISNQSWHHPADPIRLQKACP